ncbi:MAG: DUF3631 domain-containing protein [Alphaproteobacteria bacterium]
MNEAEIKKAAERAEQGSNETTTIIELSKLNPFEYDRNRKPAAEALGIKVSTLDQEVRKCRADVQVEAGQGKALTWEEPEPWHTPVSGPQLLDDITDFILQFVVLDEKDAHAAALWVMMTWLHDRLEVAPFLNITSATKRCGKSTFLDVLEALVRNPMPVSGRITSAALFRSIELYTPTLLLDEVDTFFRDDPELRGVINGSQRRSGAWTLRCVGEDNEPRRFATFCPKALVGIGGLPDTVTDRSIVIRLERRPHNANTTNWRDRNQQQLKDLQRRIVRWIVDNTGKVLVATRSVEFPNGLDDRAQDSWEALLAVSSVAGGDWIGKGKAACTHACLNQQDKESSRELILADIKEVFESEHNPDALETSKIIRYLNNREDRPWCEWARGKELTSHGLAKMLKPFAITPGTVRLANNRTAKGYKRSSFEKVWEMYLPGDESVTTSQPA